MKQPILDHMISGSDRAELQVQSVGVPDCVGVYSRYEITGFPSDPLKIQFQSGDPAEEVNGVTDEALLAVLIDRARDRWAGMPEGERDDNLVAALELAMEAFKESGKVLPDGPALKAATKKKKEPRKKAAKKESKPISLGDMQDIIVGTLAEQPPADDVIEAWTQEQRELVADYCGAVHFKASDNNDVVVPPRPGFFPEGKDARGAGCPDEAGTPQEKLPEGMLAPGADQPPEMTDRAPVEQTQEQQAEQ